MTDIRTKSAISTAAALPPPAVSSAGPRQGSAKVVSIGGVPVFIHWSFPLGGILASIVGKVDPREWAYYIIAYTLLVLAHESGHILAALLLRLKLYTVEISGAGGLCRMERPRSIPQMFLVYSAGLLVQAGVFFTAVGYSEAYGTPTHGLRRALFFTMTLVNCWIFAVNLIPHRSARSGLATDGSVLWRLILHVCLRRPHPFPSLAFKPPDQAPVFSVETQLLDKPGFCPPGFMYGIEILNDQTTPMDFVVTCLINHLGLKHDQAILKMIEIHNTGGLLWKLPTADHAQRIAAAMSAASTAVGHKLVCRYVSTHKRE